MSKYLKILLVVLLPYSVAWGQQESSLPGESEGVSLEDRSEQDSTLTRGNTKIWLDKGVSLEGYNKVMLFHIQDATNRKLSSDILDRLTSLIRIKLEGAGITVIQPGHLPTKASVKVKPIITKYEPGSAGGRWLSPGLGATTCIIRATIIHTQSNEVIGEIISWKQVSSGGLFSVGAKKYVPKETAEAIAGAFVEHTLK